MTMALVSTTTVGAGGVTDITFSSIPQTATDLVLRLSLGNTSTLPSGGDQKLWIQFNASATGYVYRALSGTGSAASSGLNGDGVDRIATGMSAVPVSGTSSFSNITVYIPNYAGSTNKAVSIDSAMEANAVAAYMDIDAAIWSNTAAITSIKLFGNNSFSQYSVASLYTITKGSGGATVA